MSVMEQKVSIKTVYMKAYFMFCALFSVAADIFLEETEARAILSFLIIGASLLLLICHRKSLLLLFILGVLAYANYSICFVNYISYASNTMFTGLANAAVGLTGAQILLLFTAILGLFMHSNTSKYELPNLFNQNVCRNNRYYLFHFSTVILLALILIFAYARPETAGERGSPSTIYEYSILLVTVGLYYSAESRFIRSLYVLMAALYAAQNFMFGGRITGLQLIFILLLFWGSSRKISWKMWGMGIALYLCMITIGELRGQILSGTFTGLTSAVSKVMERGFSLDTAYSSYFTSLQFVLVADATLIGDRLYMGLLQMISYIVGGTIMPEANIALYVGQFYKNYMGGVLPFFGYFCFGWLGVVFYALLTCAYLNRFVKISGKGFSASAHGFLVCTAVYLAATAFRWYLYTPNNLIRGVLLLGIVYYISQRVLSFEKLS